MDDEVSRCRTAGASGLKTVLFICSGNSVRSQIAEALVNHYLKDRWAAFSAGFMPMEVNRNVIKVMAELGIDMSGRWAKHIDLFKDCSFDRIITLCSDADGMCLNYPVHEEKDRIVFHDPVTSYGFMFSSLSLYRDLRDEMKKKLIGLFGEG
ncbi:MAG: arsenate reductase ArsC [Deltaproteobacteria bacterium]|nr:arsenate reductase ArsC [Deltaproteobacteria bacterium]